MFFFLLQVVFNVSWNQRKTVILPPSNQQNCTNRCMKMESYIQIISYMSFQSNLPYITFWIRTKTSANNFIITPSWNIIAHGGFAFFMYQDKLNIYVDQKKTNSNHKCCRKMKLHCEYVATVTLAYVWVLINCTTHMCSTMSTEKEFCSYVWMIFWLNISTILSSVFLSVQSLSRVIILLSRAIIF